MSGQDETLAARITRVPIAYDKVAGSALDLGATGPAKDLLTGAAGSSRYLAMLLDQERDWIVDRLETAPEASFSGLLEDIQAAPSDGLADTLRRAKRRMALLVALADLGGVWGLDQVTHALSDFADKALDRGLAAGLETAIARGRAPFLTEDHIATFGGIVLLGMGKLGARELNYSSDIDLIALFDDTRYSEDEYNAVRPVFIKIIQGLVKLFSEITAGGYVFRTDLRLRPNPAVTPVCVPMEAAESYYESLGRTWERAAMIKARPVAGDLEAGKAFLSHLRPFIWRRHLDFPAIQDAHEMLSLIHISSPRDQRGSRMPSSA